MYHIKRCRFSGDRGLSLLEVLISMVILAVGILGLAPMVVLSIEGNTISRDFSVASELAKQQLEEYEAMGPIMPDDPALDSIAWLDTVYVDDLPDTLGYTRWVRITPVDEVNPPTLCKVEVQISWTDNMGNGRSTKHATLMINN
jgi:prepilin-type N-terminal cleavage/methylation domain-containing protein